MLGWNGVGVGSDSGDWNFVDAQGEAGLMGCLLKKTPALFVSSSLECSLVSWASCQQRLRLSFLLPLLVYSNLYLFLVLLLQRAEEVGIDSFLLVSFVLESSYVFGVFLQKADIVIDFP